MPFTVITLKKVPDSLRGDLTRWMQEIATGIYVGSYNSRVREYLWKRVTDTIGKGEATMCYSCRNEIGYSFCTYNTERQVVDFDGIPLVLIPVGDSSEENAKEIQHGFSNASKYLKAKRKFRNQGSSVLHTETEGYLCSSSLTADKRTEADIVFLDIETTGLHIDSDQIIEIGAIKVSEDQEYEFHRLIRTDVHIPDVVSELTGITDDLLSGGTELETGIKDLNTFIQGAVLVGYNIAFDIRFLNEALMKYSMEPIHNKTLDLMHEAKRRNRFQINYKFETTLKEHGIDQIVHHRALEDAKLMYRLYARMEMK